jgi:hypothetical protein
VAQLPMRVPAAAVVVAVDMRVAAVVARAAATDGKLIFAWGHLV